MVEGIYAQRTFVVRDAFLTSSAHCQAAEIAQGCPLSPYLFTVVMTIVLLDASKLRGEVGGPLQEKPYIATNELLYADDSMLIGSDASAVQAHLDSVTTVGQTYGLELNVEKTILLRIRGTLDIYGADGKPLAVKEEAIYLGSLISADGRTPRELSRKLGEAQQLFQKLEAIWKHANISEKRRACIFEACVCQSYYMAWNRCGCYRQCALDLTGSMQNAYEGLLASCHHIFHGFVIRSFSITLVLSHYLHNCPAGRCSTTRNCVRKMRGV